MIFRSSGLDVSPGILRGQLCVEQVGIISGAHGREGIPR